MFTKANRRKIYLAISIPIALFFLIPQQMINPVVGAGDNSWNHSTFWYYP